MIVRELIKIFKQEWLPVTALETLDKKAEVTRALVAGQHDADLLLAFDSMPLWKLRGLGPKRAMELWVRGVRPGSVERHLKLLPEATRTALRYRPLERIPRAVVEEAAAAFIPPGTKSRCTVVGSYRRGLATSGDVDILYLGDTGGHSLERFMQRVDQHLNPEGKTPRWILMAQGPSKIAGIFLLSATKRVEVDIWISRSDDHAAMLLYSTGSRDHNIRMRHVAKYRGMKLNQYGLFKGPKLDQLVATKTEREIFDRLEMKWRAPAAR